MPCAFKCSLSNTNSNEHRNISQFHTQNKNVPEIPQLPNNSQTKHNISQFQKFQNSKTQHAISKFQTSNNKNTHTHTHTHTHAHAPSPNSKNSKKSKTSQEFQNNEPISRSFGIGRWRVEFWNFWNWKMIYVCVCVCVCVCVFDVFWIVLEFWGLGDGVLGFGIFGIAGIGRCCV